MKVVLPVDGYATVNDLIETLQSTQGDAHWLLKPHGHWHGGIHLEENISGSHGFKNMTDGQIVAYRLNDDYQRAPCGRKMLKFSTTFILIKSTCTPDNNFPSNSLDFYTLWMQLAPASRYGCDELATVMASRLKVREDSTASSWVSDGISPDTPINPSSDNLVFFGAPTDSGGTLPRGSIVEILKEGHFFLNRRAAPFAFVRVISLPTGKKSSLAVGETGWVSGLDKYLKRRPSAMPAWMQKAKVHGVFNQIVNLHGDQRITVSAGDKIGHAAHYELPDDKSCTFSHLEIFSQDNRLPDFVNNKADITLGAKLLKSEAGKTLWLHPKQGNCFVVKGGDEPRYTHATHYTSLMDANKIETEGKIWYFIAKEHGWLPASEVTEVEQYNLSERGFLMLSQDEQPSDITQGFHESWVHRVISTLNLRASEQNGLYSLRVSELYQSLLRRWDLDGDGELSYVELWKGLHNRESWCQDIVQRLIVKHHSEWRHAADSTLWKPTLAELAKRYPSLAQYNQVQINDLVWMEEVPEIRCEEALWHMHPIIFLDAISRKKGLITLAMLRKVWSHPHDVSDSTLQQVADELNANLDSCHLDSEFRLYHFMAQVRQEAGANFSISENLNYSPSALPIFFSYYRRHPDEQQMDGRTPTHPANQENIANKAYGGRNGNNLPGDGWRFRGRGLKQLTGRNNYQKLTEYHRLKWGGDIDFVDQPELLSDNIKYAVRSALSFWDKNKIYVQADKGFSLEASLAVTNIVNNGLSLDEKKTRYKNLEDFLTRKIFQGVY